MLDVARDPRWGRVAENFGEDPTLVSHFGMAYVRGLQSEGLAKGVMATGKHFVGHSLSQGRLIARRSTLGCESLKRSTWPHSQAVIRETRPAAQCVNAYPRAGWRSSGGFSPHPDRFSTRGIGIRRTSPFGL